MKKQGGKYMNINYNNTQNFQALNYHNVSAADRIFIRKDLRKLRELGEQYNIRLTSSYADVENFSAIDVDVKPLSKHLSFWRKIFPPIGHSTFQPNKTSILESVQKAIKDLAGKQK